MVKRSILILALIFLTAVTSGCNLSEKANTLKDDLVNVSKDQIAMQLENSLNEQFPGVQLDVPAVTDGQGNIDWDTLKNTEVGNYVFYSFGDYEFRSVLTGDGVFKIERINHATNETFSYAEFNVTWDKGKFEVTAE